MVDGLAKGNVVLVRVDNELRKAYANQVEGEDGGRCDKGEEVSVVALADAVIQPHAMVIVRLDAVIAKTAVVGTRRPPDVARPAVLDGKLHGGSRRLR